MAPRHPADPRLGLRTGGYQVAPRQTGPGVSHGAPVPDRAVRCALRAVCCGQVPVERIVEKPYTRKVYIERIIEQVVLAFRSCTRAPARQSP